jgi:hypothetical protein
MGYTIVLYLFTEKVKASTDAVRGDSDAVVKFLLDNYEKTNDSKAAIDRTDMMERYNRVVENPQKRPNLSEAVERVFGVKLSSHVTHHGDKGFRNLKLIN